MEVKRYTRQLPALAGSPLWPILQTGVYLTLMRFHRDLLNTQSRSLEMHLTVPSPLLICKEITTCPHTKTPAFYGGFNQRLKQFLHYWSDKASASSWLTEP